jgi:hypothetical protein
MESDKLLIEASSPNDEFRYIGEIPAAPLIDLNEIRKLFEQKTFKIIAKN